MNTEIIVLIAIAIPVLFFALSKLPKLRHEFIVGQGFMGLLY